MDALWAAGGPLTVRQLLETLNERRTHRLAYTTVMTVMTRLVAKGALRRTAHGRGFVYEPVAAGPAALAVRNVVDEFGDAAVAEFVNEARADPELLQRLQRLLDE